MTSILVYWIRFMSLYVILLGNWQEVDGDNKTSINQDVSSSSSDVKRHLCCARHPRIINVGHGISGQVIQVDVGYCKNFCPHHFVDDPGDASRPAVQKCMPNTHCRSKTARLERISTIEGIQTVEVVETCDCSTSYFCRRNTYLQAIYVGTPFQHEIDIGACVGSCKKFGCRPSKNSSISVHGPNGNEVYQVIQKCACAGSCHRMDRVETILDFSGVEIKGPMRIADVRPVIRHVNVGQCVGSCSGNGTEKCLLRDIRNPMKCLAGLHSQNFNCTPAKFKVHEFRTRRGLKREIIQITQCACV
ncbi:hypothetical protein QAD02_000634 [Eretmocerus hayati]|uniref:Uncharacterized protein n=1 Tax=Eretmocerus hayati TaxID=131215 RepID=A0ACC2NIJ3_9HYME|nr:hypothetical protein QAD02_000634 [Eretmocerus hayati]